MMNLLGQSFFEGAGLMIILAVVLIGMFAMTYFRNKKFKAENEMLRNALVVGTKVKTYSGLYGTIEKIEETTDGKVATINFSTTDIPFLVEMDLNAVYGIDKKELLSEVEKRYAEEDAALEAEAAAKSEEILDATRYEEVEAEVAVEEKPKKPRKTTKKDSK